MTKKVFYSSTWELTDDMVLKDANVAGCFGLTYVIKHPQLEGTHKDCGVQLLPHTGQPQESHHVPATMLSMLAFR